MHLTNQLPDIFGQFTFWLIFGIGVAVGSFLNVIIQRMPKAFFGAPEIVAASSPWSCLFSSPFTAPCCHKAIAWRDNIPVVSWLLLMGRCRYCSSVISVRYILVELLAGLSFAGAYIAFGLSIVMTLYCLLFALLIVLFWIDLETYYLPDCCTLSILWLGLVGGALGYLSLDATQAILGACIGYGLPWTINFAYRLWRKRDGFGGGDFKLLAALGAWLGVGAIISILMIASIGALAWMVALSLLRKQDLSLEQVLPFGPFLIMAGILILVYGLL